MRNINLGDVLLGLRNLSTERRADMLVSATGKLYAAKLDKQQIQIEALPEVARAGRPLAQALATKDSEHDGYGEAIFYFTEVVQCLPSAPATMKEAVQRIRDGFVPKLGVLRASYADEAANAARKRPLLDSLKTDLQSIPVPYPAGGTLLDWATSFVHAGDEIDKLLNDRSLMSHETLSAPALKIRATTIGLLSRFRAALIDEIEEDTTLPRDLERRIFSYFDQLEASREDAAARRNKAAKTDDHDNSPSPAPDNSGG